MGEESLRACPLCGGEADYAELYTQLKGNCRISYVKCTICGCQTNPIRWPATGELDMFKYQKKMRARVRKLWNKRKRNKGILKKLKNTKAAHISASTINMARWANKHIDCRGYDKCPAGKLCERLGTGRSCTKVWVAYFNSTHK